MQLSEIITEQDTLLHGDQIAYKLVMILQSELFISST